MMLSCCLNDSSCSAANFIKLFDLGYLPLGNPTGYKKGEETWTALFELKKCAKCNFVQATHKVPFDKLADENFYVSDVSQTIIENYKRLLITLPLAADLSRQDLILEIGCGDGTLLKLFYENGYKNVIGIEPNNYQRTFPFRMINGFFNTEMINILKAEKMAPDLVILNSVIETISDLNVFFSDLFSFMRPASYVFIEVPYFISYINHLRIDAFSHLTSNWFTAGSLTAIMEKYNFNIVNFEVDEDYRGGSVKMLAQKQTDGKTPCKTDLFLEQEEKILNDKFFFHFNDKIAHIKEEISNKIQELKSKNIPLYAYGGGLKAGTLINWLGLTNEEIKLAVDKDKTKHGKFIPQANIHIDNLEKLPSENIAVIVFALNYLDEVVEYLKKHLRKKAQIIIPLPELKIIEI